MLDPDQHLSSKIFTDGLERVTTRHGFGVGLYEAAKLEPRIMILISDVTESAQVTDFVRDYPDRYVELGVAEQNLATVASGLAAVGKIPFIASYAAFSPGRNWEQIRTTIALNDVPVKIVGLHTGLSVTADGATHQMLEDLALMRSMPNMPVVVPCDSEEARKATRAIANVSSPYYLRLTREKTPLITTEKSPFGLGQAQVWQEGGDVTLIFCGPVCYEVLLATKELKKHQIDSEVINCSSLKPLDRQTILRSVRKTGCVVTIEEGQVNGGLGSAIAELLGEELPAPMTRIGVQGRFGQSGTTPELWREYELDAPNIVEAAHAVIKRRRGRT